jgi:hypothetical protein
MQKKILFSFTLLFGSLLNVGAQCAPPANVIATNFAVIPGLNSSISWNGPVDTFYVAFGSPIFQQSTGVVTVIDTSFSFTNTPCDSLKIYVARKCGTDTSIWVGPVNIYTPPPFSIPILQSAMRERICGDSIYSYTQKGFQFGNNIANSPGGGASTLVPLVNFNYGIQERRYMYADGSGTADSTLTYYTPWVNNQWAEALVFFFFSNNIAFPGDNVTLKVHVDNGLSLFKNVYQYSGDSPNWKRKIIDVSPYLSTQTNRFRIAFQIDQTTAALPEYNDFVIDQVFVGDTGFCTFNTPNPKNNIQRTGSSITVLRTLTSPIVHAQWGPIGFTPGNGQFGDTTVYNTNTLTINNTPLGTEWMYLKDTCSAYNPMYWYSAPWKGPYDVDSTNIDYFFGKAFLETDNDCILDSGETALFSEHFYIENKTTNSIVHLNPSGYFSCPSTPGGNQLEFKERLNLGMTLPSNCSSNLINFYPDSLKGAVQDFVRKPTTYVDLAVATSWQEAFLQGAPRNWGVTIFNYSANVAANLNLFVTVDTLRFIVSNLNGFTPVSANSNTYTISPPNLYPYHRNYITMPQLTAKIGAQYLGNSIFQIRIDTLQNESNKANNTFNKIVKNVAAIDPNDKQVWPEKHITDTSVTQLNYRIRFQNTGNFPAEKVEVVDSLPSAFIKENLFVLGASHEYYLSIDSNNIAKFQFYNIQLPDSASDPEGSQGFIDFSVLLDQPMAVGDSIANRAHIFFDYQPAVITNWAWTKIVMPSNIGEVEAEGLKFNMYPNPANTALRIELVESGKYTITLTDLAGRVLLTKNLEGRAAELDVHNLPNGVYVIGIHNEAKNVSGYQRVSVMH